MRTRLTLALIFGLLFTIGLVFAPTFTSATIAQDTMSPHVCDSTLITTVFVAESEFGYHPMMDMTTYDLGQFKPWFDEMMAMMQDDQMMEATDEAMMQDDQMMEATPEMMMEMPEGTTILQPSVVQGEDQACTDLRADVEKFLYDYVSSEMMSDSAS